MTNKKKLRIHTIVFIPFVFILSLGILGAGQNLPLNMIIISERLILGLDGEKTLRFLGLIMWAISMSYLFALCIMRAKVSRKTLFPFVFVILSILTIDCSFQWCFPGYYYFIPENDYITAMIFLVFYVSAWIYYIKKIFVPHVYIDIPDEETTPDP